MTIAELSIWAKSIDSNFYVKYVFDPVQTHALYGVINSPSNIKSIKNQLKEIGATHLRVVKNKEYVTICFKYNQ